MSLRTVVAAPFRGSGRSQMAESEFVVAVSLDRDWFSPDQTARLVERAIEVGLLRRTGEAIQPTFDPESVSIPPDFAPDESLFSDRAPFERVLDRLVAEGAEKREAVAGINRLQADLDVAIEAAAIVYARRAGLDVSTLAADAREAVLGE